MAEEAQQKQFDLLAKTEALLEAPVFSKLLAFAFYGEFVLRHFYGLSLGDFSTFAALRDFATGIKPLSLVFIMAGAAVVPRAGLITWRLLQELLFNPTYYFRKGQRTSYDRLDAAGKVMSLSTGKELARKKKDDYLLKECAAREEGERKLTVTQINFAAIFTIIALNLLFSHYGQVGLIMHNWIAQSASLLATGIYAGFYAPEHYDWVLVPDGYTKEEIHPTWPQQDETPLALTGRIGVINT